MLGNMNIEQQHMFPMICVYVCVCYQIELESLFYSFFFFAYARLLVALPGGIWQQRGFDPFERNERLHHPVIKPEH